MKKQKKFNAVALAEKYKEIYDAFLHKGFTTDQAFQLLLGLVKKEKI